MTLQGLTRPSGVIKERSLRRSIATVFGERYSRFKFNALQSGYLCLSSSLLFQVFIPGKTTAIQEYCRPTCNLPTFLNKTPHLWGLPLWAE